MSDTARNLIQMTVSSVASAGLGTLTLGSAVADYLAFEAGDDGLTFTVTITETGVGQEVNTGCTYTHSGTTLTRGTLEKSTTGAAIAFSSAAIVSVVAAASWGNNVNRLMRGLTPGGRLTTESGVPVSTSDRTAQSTIYYTPFVHDQIVLWDGTNWRPYTFTETSLALSGLTSDKPYDVFGYVSSGVLALELLVWTNDTTRATAVTLQDGRYCKSGDKTRLLLGTIYTTGTTTTADAAATRYVGNVYNQQARRMFSCPAYSDGGSVTSYSLTSATWSEANAGTGSRVSYVLPLPAMAAVGIQAVGDPAATFSIGAGIGNDSSSTASIELLGVTSARISASTLARFQKDAGKHFGALLLRTSGGTATIYADDARSGGSADPALTLIHGEVCV